MIIRTQRISKVYGQRILWSVLELT